MRQGKKLWAAQVVGSKVVRIDPIVFRALQRIAIESGLEAWTPAQVLRKVFEENGLLELVEEVSDCSSEEHQASR